MKINFISQSKGIYSYSRGLIIRVGTVQSSPQSPEPYIGTEPSVLEIFSLSVHSPSVPVHIDMQIKLTI